MSTESNSAHVSGGTDVRAGRNNAARWTGVIGACIAAVSLGALPFVADAAVPATGCPADTSEFSELDYDPPVDTIAVPNLEAIVYVLVDTSNGRFLIGDGSTLNGTTVDVVAETGAPASRSGFCKSEAGAPTTTSTTTSTTTTTVPDSTTTSTTSTSTTTSTTSTTTSTTVPASTTTTTVPVSTTTTIATDSPSTTTIATASPPTTPPPTTVPTTSPPTTTPQIGILPPRAAIPAADPPAVAPPAVSPPVTQLPVTGRSSADTLLIGLAAIGIGMMLIGISRRTA